MVEMFDRVRIKPSEDTERLGLARREGQVYGWTTPSITEVSVIGLQSEDFAINVHFDELRENFWFSEDLVEFVEHGAGTASPDGQDSKFVRTPDGDWRKQPRSK